jgi:hypothetical protein
MTSPTGPCSFAGTGCPDSRFAILGVLIMLTLLALSYGAYQLMKKNSTSSKGLLRWTIAALLFNLGVIIARFFEDGMVWATAILLVLSYASFFLGGMFCVVNLLLRPARFMSVEIPVVFW